MTDISPRCFVKVLCALVAFASMWTVLRADTIEFRSFRIEGVQPKEENIIKMLNANGLGLERAIKAKIKNGRFEKDKTKELRSGLKNRKVDQENGEAAPRVGVKVSGTVVEGNGFFKIDFTYQHSRAEGNVVREDLDIQDRIKPVIASFRTKTTRRILEDDIGLWSVHPVLPGAKETSYVAFRFIK